ncbi:MAG: hypothetical protein IT430_14335 [Phycisphaerales bacterium]|nr:hypothetical protein [Phycisphaerales bacterium]
MPDPAEESASPTLLEQHLAACDDACPMCGYNLHNLRGDKCPECGQELTLQIALAEPRMAAFITGLVGLAAGAGFCGFALIITIIESLMYDYWDWGDTSMLAIGAVAFTFVVIVWCRRSARIRRMSSSSRWKFAVGAWLLPILAVALFALIAWW